MRRTNHRVPPWSTVPARGEAPGTTRQSYRTMSVLALCAVVTSSCGSRPSIDSGGTNVGTASSKLAATTVQSTTDCGIPAGFGATGVPPSLRLRSDQPESDAPIEANIKRPIVSTPQAALDEVVQRFKFSDIKVARFGDRPDAAALGGPWLYVLASVPSDTGLWRVRADFEAVTILGEAAELAVTSNDLVDSIGGYVLNLQTPDCRIVYEAASAIGPRAAGQVFAATGNTADIDFAKNVLSKYGVTPVNVATLNGASVLTVTASIPDAKAMNGNLRQMFQDLKGVPLRFASVYLRLQTDSGEDLAILISSPRLAYGSSWVQTGLEETL